MWSPEKSAELLKLHLPTPTPAQWGSKDTVRGRIVQTVLLENKGNLNGYSPQDLNDLYDRVTANIKKRRVHVMPVGASCFCRIPCDCSTRLTDQYDMRDINDLILRTISSPFWGHTTDRRGWLCERPERTEMSKLDKKDPMTRYWR